MEIKGVRGSIRIYQFDLGIQTEKLNGNVYVQSALSEEIGKKKSNDIIPRKGKRYAFYSYCFIF